MRVLEKSVLGYPIRVQVQKLDEGWDILVIGGSKTHVGAVTLAEPDGTEQTLERPGHKDSHISRTWAPALAKALNAPVSVRCGIHYDGVTKVQIERIVDECSTLLQQLKENNCTACNTVSL